MSTVQTFTTLFSTYEVDPHSKFIRRISGANGPTPFQGEDGTWRPYTEISTYAGGRLLIVFDEMSATLTSPVTDGWRPPE